MKITISFLVLLCCSSSVRADDGRKLPEQRSYYPLPDQAEALSKHLPNVKPVPSKFVPSRDPKMFRQGLYYVGEEVYTSKWLGIMQGPLYVDVATFQVFKSIDEMPGRSYVGYEGAIGEIRIITTAHYIANNPRVALDFQRVVIDCGSIAAKPMQLANYDANEMPVLTWQAPAWKTDWQMVPWGILDRKETDLFCSLPYPLKADK